MNGGCRSHVAGCSALPLCNRGESTNYSDFSLPPAAGQELWHRHVLLHQALALLPARAKAILARYEGGIASSNVHRSSRVSSLRQVAFVLVQHCVLDCDQISSASHYSDAPRARASGLISEPALDSRASRIPNLSKINTGDFGIFESDNLPTSASSTGRGVRVGSMGAS